MLGLLPTELHLRGRFWTDMAGFNTNTAGFIIVGMFVVTWAAALAIWSFGKVEEKWSTKLPSVESLPT